jgi:hypothetical protein
MIKLLTARAERRERSGMRNGKLKITILEKAKDD